MCIFCKIINQEIPAYRVYEDEQVLAFLDIKPVNPGHTLVIPKKHYQNLEEIPEEELKYLITVVKKVAYLLKTKLGLAAYNLSVNNGRAAGQEVEHLHFHLIPRDAHDQHRSWLRTTYAPGAAEEIIKKLRS